MSESKTIKTCKDEMTTSAEHLGLLMTLALENNDADQMIESMTGLRWTPLFTDLLKGGGLHREAALVKKARQDGEKGYKALDDSFKVVRASAILIQVGRLIERHKLS